MKKTLRIIGIILGFIIFLACGYYFIENSFDNLFNGNIYINITTAMTFIYSAIGLYFIWNAEV